ncbi:MAG: rod shape-determining protein [Desulfurivibrio sp.]|nr:rod shape-determining protein [Desulfurivibrio sp.]
MSKPEAENRLLLGIDLGTARTAVVSNRGARHLVDSVVGYPRDIIALKTLGESQVFGARALEHKSALTLYHPLSNGTIAQDRRQDYNAAGELLRHVIALALAAETDVDHRPARVSGVIAVPATLEAGGRQTLTTIAGELLSAFLLVDQPLPVAYHLERLDNSLLIDIGAGGITICPCRGRVPATNERVILPHGGDHLDQQLQSLINQRYPEVRMTRELARRIKEEHAYVGSPPAPVVVTLRAAGKPRQYDLSEELGLVCQRLVPEITERLTALLREFDPEDLDEVLQNIFLTGGGAHIQGLPQALAQALADYGQVRVSALAEPEYAGALGALRLAAELPPERWHDADFTVNHEIQLAGDK